MMITNVYHVPPLDDSAVSVLGKLVFDLFTGSDYRASVSTEQNILFDELMCSIHIYGPVHPGTNIIPHGRAWFDHIDSNALKSPEAFLSEVRAAAGRFINSLDVKGRVPSWVTVTELVAGRCAEDAHSNTSATVACANNCVSCG